MEEHKKGGGHEKGGGHGHESKGGHGNELHDEFHGIPGMGSESPMIKKSKEKEQKRNSIDES